MEKSISRYPESLIYFMWPWQVHFMISCKVSAEYLFREIDIRLQPTAFLIGFQIDKNNQRKPICYEPEKMEFLQDDFADINNIAKEISEADPRKNMFYTGGMQEEMNDRRWQGNLKEAIKTVLDNSSSFFDKIHFVSSGINKEGYKVYIILQLNKTIYESYQFLHYIDPEIYFEKKLSFIDSTIEVYLEDWAHRLYFPDAGKNTGPKRDSNEMLRTAANNFCYTIALAGGTGGMHYLFSACNAISIMKYEGKENLGHLIVCPSEHPDLKLTLELDVTFSITEHRKLRKLLELTTNDIGVITSGGVILGLGKIDATYDGKKEDVFHIYFRGTHCFDILHKEQPVLIMRNGDPKQVGQIIVHQKFEQDAKRVFPDISESQISQLYILSSSVAQSGKGCMLVFIADASEEALRLTKQCIAIKPIRLNEDTVRSLISIDGAIIINLDGFAYAKGAILDGMVGLEGDSSRGSRYNSALTYQEFRGWKKPTMIVVVSEDGMVDVIPNLKPLIRHSEIKQFLKTLESLNSTESFNAEAFYNTMDLLNNRAFYFTEEECNYINTLKDSLQKLDQSAGGKTMWRIFDNFIHNPKMNSHYYISEI